MSIRSDLEQEIVGLLMPLVGDGALDFRIVKAVTKTDLEEVLLQELPEAPFALVSYAGRDGQLQPGGIHMFQPRISVLVGGINLVDPVERRQDVYDLLERVDDVLMDEELRLTSAQGILENTGESLVGFVAGVEVWEQVYRVKQWIQ